ncbi:hypothetical protein SUDANB176_07182 [Streptomyces sp. enrichment culture]|uniref:hypothetical protein n=1 Tax=Streptomyces sp. enrichment culture TaxID=1795815 RepID=UPI003F56C098
MLHTIVESARELLGPIPAPSAGPSAAEENSAAGPRRIRALVVTVGTVALVQMLLR